MVDQWVSAMEAVSAVEAVSGNSSTCGGRLQCVFSIHFTSLLFWT